MSTPEDKKIDFEKLKLSEDLSDSLEPVAEGAPERLQLEQEAEAEAKAEKVPAEGEEKAEQAESDAGEGLAVPPASKFRGLLKKLSAADPFTVMLAMTVAALLIAILCCLVELGRYGFRISAKEAKNSVTMTAPIDIPRSSC